MTTRLIPLTQATPAQTIQVGVDAILSVTPHGSGSYVNYTNGTQVIVTEAPADIATLANA